MRPRYGTAFSEAHCQRTFPVLVKLLSLIKVWRNISELSICFHSLELEPLLCADPAGVEKRTIKGFGNQHKSMKLDLVVELQAWESAVCEEMHIIGSGFGGVSRGVESLGVLLAKLDYSLTCCMISGFAPAHEPVRWIIPTQLGSLCFMKRLSVQWLSFWDA